MYNRKRITRGAGVALAVWGAIGLIIMSTGVAYAVPLAGLGGFNIAADEISANNMLLYQGVGDTSTMEHYPQTIVELQDVTLDGLWLYKTFDMDKAPGLTGQARVYLWTGGETTADNVLVKSSALSTDGGATFRDFAVTERGGSRPGTQFQITADDGITLEQPRINAHYLASSKLTVRETKLVVCYDYDEDDEYEMGTCPSGDPISQSYATGSRPAANPPEPEINNDPTLGEAVEGIGEDIGGIAEPIGDAVGGAINTVGDALDTVTTTTVTIVEETADVVEEAADTVGGAVESAVDEVGSWFGL